LPQISLTQLEEKDRNKAPLNADRRSRRNRNAGPGGGLSGANLGDGFGPARFGQGGEVVRGVAVKVGDPQFTLIWDTNHVDIDLHVIEPGGDEIFFGHPNGKQGGELDVDNTWGFGPENIYWLVESNGPGSKKVLGSGPVGAYRWCVVYYGAHGFVAPPTHWRVRVKHAGEAKVVDGWLYAPGERSPIYALKVHPPKEPQPRP
jgi:hypothetical protein